MSNDPYFFACEVTEQVWFDFFGNNRFGLIGSRGLAMSIYINKSHFEFFLGEKSC